MYSASKRPIDTTVSVHYLIFKGTFGWTKNPICHPLQCGERKNHCTLTFAVIFPPFSEKNMV